MRYEHERNAALQAVHLACNLCRNVQATHRAREKLDKLDGSPVTVADFGGQALVSHHLALALPGDPLMGEEDSGLLLKEENAALRGEIVKQVRLIVPDLDESAILSAIDRGNADGGSTGRFWVLDPVDGTKGFLRGDQYAVALALVEDGRVVLGVLGCPNLPTDLSHPGAATGCLFLGVRGEGAWTRDLDSNEERPITVSAEEDPSRALFAESYESAHSSHADSAKVAEMLHMTREPIRMDSQAKYGIVARGDATIYLRVPTGTTYRENVWDHAAGTVIVEEAGGSVTDLDGKPLDYTHGKKLAQNRGILATNGRIHDTVLEAVGRRS